MEVAAIVDNVDVIVGFVVLMVGGVLAWRSRYGFYYKQTAEERGERIKELEGKVEAQAHRISELEGRIHTLSSRPDYTALVNMMRTHDDRAAARAEQFQEEYRQVSLVLGGIAKTLEALQKAA